MKIGRVLSERGLLGITRCLLFGAVLTLSWNTMAATAGEIPKGDHGAATMEHQISELDRLLPAGNLRKAPPGFDPVVWEAFIPTDNVLTLDRVKLGHKLYFEKRLSADGTVSCATCHDVTRGFAFQTLSGR